MSAGVVVMEVPTSLKRLARLVVRGFYTIEDALIIDILVRNPCMKEDDMCELLKFERKMLRQRISILRSEKFLQTRLRMETGADSKAQKVNYYFINYKADMLFDFQTNEFHCTFCGELVEEDSSVLPQQDSRVMLANFNEVVEPFYTILRELDGIRLAPELLEPEPTRILGLESATPQSSGAKQMNGMERWGPDKMRNLDSNSSKMEVTIGEDLKDNRPVVKERPIWLTESTVVENTSTRDSIEMETKAPLEFTPDVDIMTVLLQHEKRAYQTDKAGKKSGQDADSSDEPSIGLGVEELTSEEEKDDEDVPLVSVAGRRVPITEVVNMTDAISQMTPSEKEHYIQVYQDYFSALDD
ncbi:general transcription factor IIE subunit 1-like isoform X2 [Metopolophium dirhodum]|uniref:general transcription factor IIE subunit 1-like isoform X2 n=1 Tax=Metopolophium dirhodum TaxID=44670 RepID=UPI00298FF491|nr:general transcription factor IIE subunit 1-like isoform X2 [Metopolophium dirhodum]